ncbi:MAG TPA: hypothetical protein VJX67_17695 [Blastocatellia bacterium]|nr:hypothetical protein [Blastocatellia bacterium]
MLCFVITTVAIFLLASDCLAAEARRGTAPGLIAAAVFALNPSVLYMQSTPMSEMVFMAALTVAVLAFRRWAADKTMRRLMAAALAMSVATLSRYEAWPVAMVAVVLVGLMTAGPVTRRIRSATVYGLITAAGPLYWLWHNWAIFGNALEFYNGASSARGIYLQNQANLGWSRIFAGHVALDVCLMLATVAVCAGPLVVLIGGAGLTRLALNWRKHIRVCAPLGLLSLPFGFHVLSVYRGEIQIFPLSALGLLNVRYGLAGLLPLSLLAGLAATSFARRRRWVPGLVVLSVVVAQYGLAVSDGPADLAVYQEGYRNGVNSRQARELSKAAAFLSANHPHDMVLMNTGELGPLVSRGGLTFGEVVHEGTARWYQFQDRIPGDVATVIIRDGDGLDQRFRNNPALARDLASGLALTYQAGGIRVFERAGK